VPHQRPLALLLGARSRSTSVAQTAADARRELATLSDDPQWVARMMTHFIEG